MRVRHRSRIFCTAMLFLTLAGMSALPAGAANPPEFVDSVPQSGTTITTAPTQISLLFSMPMNPDLTGGYVHDVNGMIVSTSIKVDANDPTKIMITLAPNLSSGWYMVMWNTAPGSSEDVIFGDVTFNIA